MKDFFDNLFTTGNFMPHGHCYSWQPDVLWTHVCSDLIIALSFFAIPVCLAFIAKKRYDVEYRWLLILFGLFIVGCGATHIMGAVTVWNPVYRLEGFIKGITALASAATAIALIRITPQALQIPTPREWEQAAESLRQSQQALQQSKEHYQSLLSVFDSVIIHVDGIIQYANPAAVCLCGASSLEALMGLPVINFAHPDYREKVIRRIARVREGQQQALMEQKIVRLDGSVVDVEITTVPCEFDGQAALQTVVRDITERKQYEQKLRESEAKFRRLFELDMLGVFFSDYSERITDANDAFLKMVGYSRDEILNREITWRHFSPAEYTEKDQRATEVLLSSGTVIPYEKEYIRKDGHRVPVLLGAALIPDAQSVVAFVLDTTDLTKARLEQEQHARDLAQSNAELEQFAYIASHDLQEPLRTMAGFARLLAKKYQGKLDKDADEFIGFITDAAERMKTLISNLLEYSRIPSKGLLIVPTDLSVVLEKVRQNLQRRTEETGAAIIISPMPVIRANESQMTQLFQNLLDNALKFKDNKPLRITIAVAELAKEWQFTISDTGMGMDMAYTDRIFQVFQRLHARESYGGTGIGLAICKKIVERYGGRIWVESELGKGSVFFFTLQK